MHADRWQRAGLRRIFVVAWLWTVAGCPRVAPPSRPAPPAASLPPNGTVVLLGDSTTWHDIYPALLAGELQRRYPDRRLRFVNRGARGDTVPKALARLERDVLAERPAMVIVLLGINDGGYGPPNRHLLARYRANMTTLVRRLRQGKVAAACDAPRPGAAGDPGASCGTGAAVSVSRVVLVTTTCVRPDSWQRRAYNRMLAQMAGELRSLGGELQVPVIDLFRHFHQLVVRGEAARPRVTLMADANHPNAAGYRVVAEYLLRHLAPPR